MIEYVGELIRSSVSMTCLIMCSIKYFVGGSSFVQYPSFFDEPYCFIKGHTVMLSRLIWS